MGGNNVDTATIAFVHRRRQSLQMLHHTGHLAIDNYIYMVCLIGYKYTYQSVDETFAVQCH